MDIRKPSKVEMIVLTVAIVYLPDGWLLCYTGLDWHVIRIWPLLPGLVILRNHKATSFRARAA